MRRILCCLCVMIALSSWGQAEPAQLMTQEEFQRKMGWAQPVSRKRSTRRLYAAYSSASRSPVFKRLIDREMSRRERRRRLAIRR